MQIVERLVGNDACGHVDDAALGDGLRNCRSSAATIRGSGNTSANCIIRRRFFSANPRPNSAVNCPISDWKIATPHARFSLRMSRRMQWPICQNSEVSPALTVCATRRRASQIRPRTESLRLNRPQNPRCAVGTCSRRYLKQPPIIEPNVRVVLPRCENWGTALGSYRGRSRE